MMMEQTTTNDKQRLEVSPKQAEFILNGNKRWNAKIGATQCGKTYIDVTYIIPERLLERSGKPGLNVILGVSRGTIERNVLEPMRDFWGPALVGTINSENVVWLFGEKVYALGAEKVSQVSKMRGTKIKYCYADEMVDYSEEVFQLLKSRLSLAYSVCDFTGNPAEPTHWLKKFLDSNADIFQQNWTLYDNPFIPESYVKSLEQEYEGTVYFDRYILGLWKRAEGIIYRKFADNPERYILDEVPDDIVFLNIGIDFGGSDSNTVFTATGFTRFFAEVVILESMKIEDDLSPDELEDEFIAFASMVIEKYNKYTTTYCDHAEQILIRGIRKANAQNALRNDIRNARKMKVEERIKMVIRLMGKDKFRVMRWCENVIEALQEAVRDPKTGERLDNGTSDIDSLDSMEYSIEPFYKELIEVGIK